MAVLSLSHSAPHSHRKLLVKHNFEMTICVKYKLEGGTGTTSPAPIYWAVGTGTRAPAPTY